MNMGMVRRGSLTASASDNELLLSLEIVKHVLTEIECVRNDLFRRGCNPLTKSYIY